MKKILVTGSNGYVGKRLIPALLEKGYYVYALLRSAGLPYPIKHKNLSVIYGDLLESSSLIFPEDIDAAYYLVHSMGEKSSGFMEKECLCAENFSKALVKTQAKQVIYLTGIIPRDKVLSEHLSSRYHVEEILKRSSIPLTSLRAGILVGAGSASFEMIRDLVEKLPIMVAPKWILNKTQPIGILNAIEYLLGVLFNECCYKQSFDIGGPDILSFKEMMLQLAKVRKLKRFIFHVPVLTPRLSSYWIYLISSVPVSLASALVESMVHETVCQENKIQEILPIKRQSYTEALAKAFQKVEQNEVTSWWSDNWNSLDTSLDWQHYLKVPHYGCYQDLKIASCNTSRDITLERIFSIGGKTGWYYLSFLWALRGIFDRLVGGVGLRRGRRDPKKLFPGDALDFWRVLRADRKKGVLLLYAEMKLPGEAWLEFRMDKNKLYQRAVFRPKGLLGRIYWWLMVPAHFFIFRGLIKKLTE